MTDVKLLELIHGEMDGVNSARQSAKLKSFLAGNPKAQRLYEELTAMSAMLQEVKPVEPPSYLQHIIMNTLPPSPSAAKRLPDAFSQLWAWLTAKVEFKYAMIFVGGVLTGVVLLALFELPSLKQDSLDWSKLYGTIGAPLAEEPMPEQGRFEIKGSEVAGTISLRQAGTMLAAEIALDSPHSIDVVITFAEQNLGFKGLVQDEAAQFGIAVGAGMIKLTHVGRKGYVIVFERSDASAPAINFQILRFGEILYSQKLSP
ncbi:MAG: anti-sigma factor family protein [bacterium]